jgi:hypothetical protein
LQLRTSGKFWAVRKYLYPHIQHAINQIINQSYLFAESMVLRRQDIEVEILAENASRSEYMEKAAVCRNGIWHPCRDACVWAGVSHNSQCEFHCDGDIFFGYILLVFFGNALLSFLVFMLLVVAILTFMNLAGVIRRKQI